MVRGGHGTKSRQRRAVAEFRRKAAEAKLGIEQLIEPHATPPGAGGILPWRSYRASSNKFPHKSTGAQIFYAETWPEGQGAVFTLLMASPVQELTVSAVVGRTPSSLQDRNRAEALTLCKCHLRSAGQPVPWSYK
jgi:hypothetical protein